MAKDTSLNVSRMKKPLETDFNLRGITFPSQL